MDNYDAIAQGVTNSWDFWLNRHDVNVPDTIEVAVRGAVYSWLGMNSASLTAAIAKEVADRWEAENQ